MNRMRQLREERKITQEDLAFELDVSQQRISKIERNLTPMNENLIAKSARFFGVTADYLLGLSDIKLEFEQEEVGPGSLSQIRVQEMLHLLSRLDSEGQEMVLDVGKRIASYIDSSDRSSGY